MDEEITILLAKEGNQNAFRQLFEDNREMVYRLAYFFTRSQQEAEDMLQETFIRAFKHINQFNYKHISCFSAWLNKICCNCCLTHLRKNGRKKNITTVSLVSVVPEPRAQSGNPSKTAHHNQMIAHIAGALKKLSAKQQIIFDMRYKQQWEIKEIAEVMNCSESTIKTQLARSLQKLKNQLLPLWEEK